MTQLLLDASPVSEFRLAPVDDVHDQVWSLLAGLYPTPAACERRLGQRYPYPCLVQLTPVEGEGCRPCGPALVVVGKNLSDQGLAFYHPLPLPHRRVVAVLDRTDGSPVAFLLDLHRCRFTRQGWYESAGRILKTMDPPSASRSRRAGGC